MAIVKLTDCHCFRSELESSGSLSSTLNPRGTFRSLSDRIVDLAEMHVESRDVSGFHCFVQGDPSGRIVGCWVDLDV